MQAPVIGSILKRLWVPRRARAKRHRECKGRRRRGRCDVPESVATAVGVDNGDPSGLRVPEAYVLWRDTGRWSPLTGVLVLIATREQMISELGGTGIPPTAVARMGSGVSVLSQSAIRASRLFRRREMLNEFEPVG